MLAMLCTMDAGDRELGDLDVLPRQDETLSLNGQLWRVVGVHYDFDGQPFAVITAMPYLQLQEDGSNSSAAPMIFIGRRGGNSSMLHVHRQYGEQYGEGV